MKTEQDRKEENLDRLREALVGSARRVAAGYQVGAVTLAEVTISTAVGEVVEALGRPEAAPVRGLLKVVDLASRGQGSQMLAGGVERLQQVLNGAKAQAKR
jgi:hypothetical protein